MLDYDRLIAPVDDSDPCGPDLRGEPDFRDIEDAPGDFSSQKEAELRQVVAQCDAFLARTKDHMPAIVALQAAVRIGDLPLANAALALIKGFAEVFWDGFHPGPADEMAIARINELSALSRPAAMTLPLQRAALAALPAPSSTAFTAAMVSAACVPVPEWSSSDESALAAQVENGQITATAARAIRPTREGARTLRTVMRTLSADARAADAAADVDGEDLAMPPDAVRALALSLHAQVTDARAQLMAMSDALYDINAIYDAHAGESASLGPVLSLIGSIAVDAGRFLDMFPAQEPDAAPAAEVEADGQVAVAGVTGAAAPRGFAPSVPQSRGDVLQAIEMIARYYAEREPTSPVPLMLTRLKGWVSMDFMDLMRDIAPDAVDDVSKLLAIKEPEEEY